MPQTRHTPGPWVVVYGEQEREKNEVWAIMPAADCDYWRGRKIVETDMGAYGPNKYDAALIAAAPEMLQMLQDVDKWLETNLARGTINAGTANRNGDLVSQIRATIHKATGR